MTISKSLQSVQQRIVLVLLTGQALFTTSTIVAFTLTSIVAVELTGNEKLTGVPTTLTLAGRAAMAYPLGWLMDRLGRRFGLSLGYLIGIVGALVSAWGVLEGSATAFFAGALLIGGMRGTAEQGRYVAAEVFPTGRRAAIIGTIVFAGTIGSVVGPLLVPVAGNWALAREMPEAVGPFILSGLLIILALVVTFLFLRPDPLQVSRQVASDEASATQQPVRPGRSLSTILNDGRVRLALLAMIIGQLVMTLLMVVTPVHMDHLQHTTTAVSWVIMAHTLGMFGLSSVTGWLVNRLGRHTMIAAGVLLLLAAGILAPFAVGVPMLALSLFVLGLGWNFCFVGGSTLLSDRISAGERGRVQGAGEVMVAVSSGVGSLGSGLVFDYGGILAVGIAGLLPVLLLCAALIFTDRPEQEALSSAP